MPNPREIPLPATKITEGMKVMLEDGTAKKVKSARPTRAVRVSHDEHPTAYAIDIEYTDGGWTFAHPKQIVTVLA